MPKGTGMGEQGIPTCPPPPPPPILLPSGQDCTLKSTDPIVSNLRKIVQSKRAENVSEDEATRSLVRHLIDSLEQCQGKIGHCVTHHQHVEPLVQEGPQCGLVALCMASSLLSSCKTMDIQQVMSCAGGLGYTLQGEMFSAKNMADLARQLCGCNAEVVSGDQRHEAVTSALLSGHLVLVPYDRDHNNEPCCKKGHKAHWAMLTGILLVSSTPPAGSTPPAVEEQEAFTQDPELPQLFYPRPEWLTRAVASSSRSLHGPSTKLYVYAVQGKSVRVHLWSLDAVLESNSNLTELDPKIATNLDEYLVPDLGIEHGLRNQLIVLKDVAN